jgi:DNA-binding ferritin-like protein (Dps family)
MSQNRYQQSQEFKTFATKLLIPKPYSRQAKELSKSMISVEDTGFNGDYLSNIVEIMLNTKKRRKGSCVCQNCGGHYK